MWTVVYISMDLNMAIEIEDKLREEGFLIKRQVLDSDEDEKLYQILAPEFEAEEIQLVLFDLGLL